MCCRLTVACVVVLVAGVAVNASPVENTEKWVEQCLKKNPGATGQWSVDRNNETTANKCFGECILQKKGVLKEGKINEKVIVYEAEETAKVMNRNSKVVDIKKWKKAIHSCVLAETPAGECNKGFFLWYCIYAAFEKSFNKLKA